MQAKFPVPFELGSQSFWGGNLPSLSGGRGFSNICTTHALVTPGQSRKKPDSYWQRQENEMTYRTKIK